ncbi:MAG: RdgB/HAM1 family non-canonical purine NTP pyrophosphatase [Alphaproteobacteria bacterium]
MTPAQTPRLQSGDKLVVASHNPGKIREIKALLTPFGIETVSAADLELPEPEETGDTFEANARLKASAAADASGLPALADDSGFCVSALDGGPGIHSARYAGPGKDFGVAMERLNQEIGSEGDRTAWFVCALAIAWPGQTALTFRGEVWGDAVWPPRGSLGFGYDPMFQPGGHTMTFGEMSPIAKHAMSHRAHAFHLFVEATLRR